MREKRLKPLKSRIQSPDHETVASKDISASSELFYQMGEDMELTQTTS